MSSFATPVVVADGLGMGESVRVHDGAVWWADWSDRTVHRMPEGGGEPELVTTGSAMPVCFDWSGGELLVVSGDGAVTRADGTRFADLTAVDPYPWNEIVGTGDRVFANGIGYEYGAPAQVSGVIATIGVDGVPQRVADGLAFPNGMAVLDDTLVVAESHAGRLTAFDIGPDGTLTGRRSWAEIDGSAPDGISPGPDGTLFYADVPNAGCVQVAPGGEVLRRFAIGKGCFSCAWSADTNTLYVAAADWPGVFAGGPPSGQLLAVQL
jgi:sugar lactone lactonase YvrE